MYWLFVKGTLTYIHRRTHRNEIITHTHTHTHTHTVVPIRSCVSYHLLAPSSPPPPSSSYIPTHPKNTPIILHQQACEPSVRFISLSLLPSHTHTLSLSLSACSIFICVLPLSGFRVITRHLHCKVPCAALSSSVGD